VGRNSNEWEARHIPLILFVIQISTPITGNWIGFTRLAIVVFTGTYQRALDSKLRVLIPKRLRVGIGSGTELYLTPGTDHCLELHTEQSLNDLALRTRQSSADSKDVRSFSRLFYARAQNCDIDKQGRIRIPAALAELANLETEVAFIGVGSHWELWNVSLWDSYLDKNDNAFDRIVQTTISPSATPEQRIPPNGTSYSPHLATRITPK